MGNLFRINGHSFHMKDWLELAAAAAAAGTGAGALGYGPLAGVMGGTAGASAADLATAGMLQPAEEAAMAAELGPGAAAGGLAGPADVAYGQGAQPSGIMSALKQYGPKALKAGVKAQQMGLLGGGQQQPMPMAQPPGGGAQVPGTSVPSAQIAFPDYQTAQAQQLPLSEILRRMQMQGYV